MATVVIRRPLPTTSFLRATLLDDDDDDGWLLIPPKPTQDRELEWLLESLKDTLASLQEGVEECLALLAPADAASTLVVSTHLSEAVKGYITRSGTSVVKGSISLNLPTLPNSPSTHTISSPYPLPALTTIYSLLADCRLLLTTMLSTTPLTATFLSDQLLLLSDLLAGVQATLSGASPEHRLPSTSTSALRNAASAPPLPPSTLPPLFIRHPDAEANLSATVLPPAVFSPALPAQVAVTLALGDGAGGADGFLLTARTLVAADAPAVSLRERLGLAAQAPRHDEMNADVLYGDRQVRVREKVRVSVGDPGIVSLAAKIAAMGRVVGAARTKMVYVLDARNGASGKA